MEIDLIGLYMNPINVYDYRRVITMSLRTIFSAILALYLGFIFNNQETELSKEGQWCQLSAQISAGVTQCICTDGPLTYFPLNGGTIGTVVRYTVRSVTICYRIL